MLFFVLLFISMRFVRDELFVCFVFRLFVVGFRCVGVGCGLCF